MDIDLIGKILAGVLTLMVFSYLFGNNPLYRLAQHLFVGVSIGYAVLLVLSGVLWPQLMVVRGQFSNNIASITGWVAVVPLVLGLYLLVIRSIRPAAQGGGFVLLLAVSTAAALALGGILAGTVVPQVGDTMRPLSTDIFVTINSLVVIVGVAVTLYYFSFRLPVGGGRAGAGAIAAQAGRWLIVVSLGAVLGTLTVTFVASLVERVQFMSNIFS